MSSKNDLKHKALESRQFRMSRQLPPTVQKRAEGVMPLIMGYAAVYYQEGDPGTEYQLWPDMVERIRPGAFDRAVREDDVRGLFNHDECEVLGRTSSGTMRLSVDAKGLKYEIDPPDTETGNDVVKLLERGDVTGSSFTFIPTKTTWEEIVDSSGRSTHIRWIEEVQLFDVGPVTFPAYVGTEALSQGRSDGAIDIRSELEAWKNQRQAQADQDYANALLLTTVDD